MTLIDSHCHLNYPGLVEDEPGVLERARARGVGGFLNISTRQSEWPSVVAAAERHPDVWAAIGVHPHEADAHPELGTDAIVEAAAHPRVVAIGECGLDYHYDKSDRTAQRERFRAHMAASEVNARWQAEMGDGLIDPLTDPATGFHLRLDEVFHLD